MAVSAFKTFVAGEVLPASDLNSSIAQLLDNQDALGWPRTTSAAMAGFELFLDADSDSSITADTDDEIDIKLGGVDVMKITGTRLTFLGERVTTVRTLNRLGLMGIASKVADLEGRLINVKHDGILEYQVFS